VDFPVQSPRGRFERNFPYDAPIDSHLRFSDLLHPCSGTCDSYNREQLVILFAVGVIFLAVGFAVYGGLYFFYTTYITEIEVRQRTIRFALMFLTVIVNTWFLIVIFYKKGIK
jgi:hypothetical protein